MKATTLSPLVAAAAVLCAGPALADDCAGQAVDGTVKLTVQTIGLRNSDGLLAVTVYGEDPRRFLARGGKLLRQRPKAETPATTACFWLRPGTYAIAVYHDRNGNKDFDRTKVGMPAEGFGFSNDAPTRYGLPSFDRVRFRLPAGGRTLKITLRYPDGR